MTIQVPLRQEPKPQPQPRCASVQQSHMFSFGAGQATGATTPQGWPTGVPVPPAYHTALYQQHFAETYSSMASLGSYSPTSPPYSPSPPAYSPTSPAYSPT